MCALQPGGLNVSIQWAAGPCNNMGISCSGPGYNPQLLALVTALPNATQAANLSDWAVAVGARYICWNGEQGLCTAGSIAVKNAAGHAGSIMGTTAGGREILTVMGGKPLGSADAAKLNLSSVGIEHALVYPLGSPVPICAYAGFDKAHSVSCSNVALKQNLAAIRNAELKSYTTRVGAELAQPLEAMQSVLQWNVLWSPSEAGPWANVDRGWGQPYCLFDWDNLFASYMLSVSSKELGYSNLFQIVKSRTMAGFIPGYAKGLEKTRDRTEPAVGSKILLEIHKRYPQDTWVVELLFDDLFNWSDWFWRRRRLQPIGLICLGSDPINTTAGAGGTEVDKNDWNVNQMQGAMYESGQDNSPLWDDVVYNNVTHHMELYDVGASAMFVMEARSLAQLADVAAGDRSAQKKALLQRADAIEKLIQAHLWDAERGIFANRFRLNNSLSQAIGPTSFYPMQAGSASVAQAEEMVTRWMSNRTRFCVSADFPFKNSSAGGNGNTSCYYGMPSISADDASYCNGKDGHCGYWVRRHVALRALFLLLSLGFRVVLRVHLRSRPLMPSCRHLLCKSASRACLSRVPARMPSVILLSVLGTDAERPHVGPAEHADVVGALASKVRVEQDRDDCPQGARQAGEGDAAVGLANVAPRLRKLCAVQASAWRAQVHRRPILYVGWAQHSDVVA